MSDIIVSKQDASQVLRLAFDDATQALRTTGTAAAETTVVQPDGSMLHTTVDSSALPTGAATEAKQDDEITALNSIESTMSDFSAKTASALVSEPYDYQLLAYVASGNGVGEIETITYKLGGSSGTLVGVVTLGYDAQNRLVSVARS